MLRIISKMSKWRSLWPPLYIHFLACLNGANFDIIHLMYLNIGIISWTSIWYHVNHACVPRINEFAQIWVILSQSMKSGGQSDLHFDILDIMRNIVKWGIIFRVFQVAWLISGIKNDLLFTGGHLGMKSGGQSDLHFDISDIMRNIVKWGIIFRVF